MIFAVVTPNQALLDWIESRIDPHHGHVKFEPASTRCTLLYDERGPIAATAIDGWTEHSCDMTIASDGTKRWATRTFLRGTYDYVFRFCGKNRISMIVAASNGPAMRMNKALGHVLEGHHRDYFGPGLDAYSYAYLRSDWEHGKWHSPSEVHVNNENDRGRQEHGEEVRASGTSAA